jgi:AraC family transcriptional regulator
VGGATGFATVTEDEGVVMTSADVNGFTLAELRFAPAYRQQAFEPELPYLALVVDGALEKSFGRRTMRLERSCAVTMPAGAVHSARFGTAGARIVIVRTRRSAHAAATCLERLVELRAPGLGWLAVRLAAELRAPDTAAPLAAEGLAFELMAAATRESAPERRRGRPPRWLQTAEELLRARTCESVRLGELAAAVGVSPTHLARAFRVHYGLSVGEYGRRLRLEAAAAELACSDRPLAAIAAEAGFADQSHFTRLFTRYAGTTPARYRRSTSRSFQDV